MKLFASLARFFAGLTGCTYESTPPAENQGRALLRPNIGWMHPESEGVKMSILDMEVGQVIESYLYFVVGDLGTLDEQDLRQIAETFFFAPFEELRFGDIEPDVTHRDVPGQPATIRLRGKLRVYPSMFLRGRYCPLYKVGKYTLFVGSESAPINFHERWNRQNFGAESVTPPAY